MKIAVLLTCFNRREMTLSCLSKLKKARDTYNNKLDIPIDIEVYLTNDGCTDGTPDAVRLCMSGETINIIEADGNAYWAGGMRLAWNEARKKHDYDFYLLLNDDTDVWDNLFDEMLEAHNFCIKEYGKSGIYSGNTTWRDNHLKMSFGGKKSNKGFLKRFMWVYPNGTPQRCDIVNANILMVAKEVVENVGIFADCYIHGAADNDYAMRVNAAGYPVVVTSGYCGCCDADNYNHEEECKKISKMTLTQRKQYFTNPVHSIHDKWQYTIRWRKSHIPILLITHFLHRYIPSLYGRIMGSLH